MSAKKIYLSLPVNNDNYIDQRNHAYNIAVGLGIKGYEAVSQFDVVPSPSIPQNEALSASWRELLECDAIYLCKGWQKSPICRSEMSIAVHFGKEIMTE